jgi:hypothetical protein
MKYRRNFRIAQKLAQLDRLGCNTRRWFDLRADENTGLDNNQV